LSLLVVAAAEVAVQVVVVLVGLEQELHFLLLQQLIQLPLVLVELVILMLDLLQFFPLLLLMAAAVVEVSLV